MWPAGLEPAARRVSDGRSTGLSYGHTSGRGWTRTSGLLLVRQALFAPELLARERMPSVHSAGRSRRSGTAPAARAVARTAEAERCFLCHSPTLRPWIAADGVLRGGALEPGAPVHSGKSACKSHGLFSSELQCAKCAGGPFSLRRGLGFD
jgi:hypothetical protein